jgi:hypothetical protein
MTARDLRNAVARMGWCANPTVGLDSGPPFGTGSALSSITALQVKLDKCLQLDYITAAAPGIEVRAGVLERRGVIQVIVGCTILSSQTQGR